MNATYRKGYLDDIHILADTQDVYLPNNRPWLPQFGVFYLLLLLSAVTSLLPACPSWSGSLFSCSSFPKPLTEPRTPYIPGWSPCSWLAPRLSVLLPALLSSPLIPTLSLESSLIPFLYSCAPALKIWCSGPLFLGRWMHLYVKETLRRVATKGYYIQIPQYKTLSFLLLCLLSWSFWTSLNT